MKFRTAQGRINKPKPLLIVLSAPSGTGKSTIVARLKKRNRNFYESVSATTRKRRKGERHKRDYFFLSPEEFRNKIKTGEFIETAEVFGEMYGTPKEYVRKSQASGRTVLFDIDVQGGMAIKKWRRDAVLIFIIPPSIVELKRRLAKRKSESEQSIEVRLSRAVKEINFWSKYDYIVCNSNLSSTVEIIEQIIRSESQRVSRFQTVDFFSER